MSFKNTFVTILVLAIGSFEYSCFFFSSSTSFPITASSSAKITDSCSGFLSSSQANRDGDQQWVCVFWLRAEHHESGRRPHAINE